MKKRARVLVVEDDTALRDTVATILSLEGYRVAVAAHGQEALDRIQEGEPDVILLDIWMPVMNGIEFARVYRQTTRRHAPIIVITAADSAKVRADEIGAEGWLSKPFGIDDLLDIMRRHS